MGNNAFETPDEMATSTVDFSDEDATASSLVRGAGFVLMLSGVFAAGTTLQMFMLLYARPWLSLWLSLIGLMGLTNMVLGPILMKGNAQAAYAGGALIAAQFLLVATWNVYALMGGLVSPMAMFAFGFSLLAVALVPLSIPSAVRTAAARRALYEGL